MKMLRVSTFLLLSAVLLAQPAAKKKADPVPPAKVDQALRARITEFLNDHVTGEFRKAEALVAEDSKDLYYNRNKPRYMSCKGIASIRYSEHFKKAYAVALCAVPMIMSAALSNPNEDVPPELMGPPTVPIPSMWKLENGKWCWYIDKNIDSKMPFGPLPTLPTGAFTQAASTLPMVPMPPGVTAPPVPQGFDGTAQPSAMDPTMLAAMKAASNVPVTDASFGPVPEEALHHVKLDPSSVEMKPGGEGQVKISNDSEDPRALMVLGQIPGVEYKLGAATVIGKGSTALTFQAGKDAKSGTIQLVVATTGEMLPIRVTVQ